MPVPTRVKICCIASIEQERLAVRAGAAAIGLVSAMPSGPGPIAEELIAEIVLHVPPGVATFLLTCLDDPQAIIAQQQRTRVNTIQLCDRIRPADYAALHSAMPGVKLVQVIHVTGEESLEEAIRIAPQVDAL